MHDGYFYVVRICTVGMKFQGFLTPKYLKNKHLLTRNYVYFLNLNIKFGTGKYIIKLMPVLIFEELIYNFRYNNLISWIKGARKSRQHTGIYLNIHRIRRGQSL